jgi:ribosomal protein L37AE/L43A
MTCEHRETETLRTPIVIWKCKSCGYIELSFTSDAIFNHPLASELYKLVHKAQADGVAAPKPRKSNGKALPAA